jgi:tetratricopeptide (TPR) repeat protein
MPQWHAAYVLPAGDLAYALQLLSREALPPPLALRVDEAARARARQLHAQCGPPPYVGITWRAGSDPDSATASEHWSPLSKQAPLAGMLAALGEFGGTVLAVQRKVDGQDLAGARPGVVDLSAHVGDLALTLALLAELDEYLCVPNTHMHMRIGAGGGCRILEPFPPDWRLEASGATSCWYPGSRVYRQTRDGDWQHALDALHADLPPALADAHGRAGMQWLQQARRLQTDAMARRKRVDVADRCYREALRCFTAATRLQPDRPQGHRARGSVLLELGELQAARESYADAHRLAPDDPALAAEHAGAVLSAGDATGAIAAYEAAIVRHPDHAPLHGGLALALLGSGEFARGWDEYEWRLRQPDAATQRGFPFPRWEGEPLAGRTLLVTSEQGIGDEVMFASCFDELIAAAGHCVLEVSKRLAPLFERSFPGATVCRRQLDREPDWAALPRIDVRIEAASVPRFLRRSREEFPRRGAYLRPDRARVAAWKERLAALGPRRKIGLAWTGGLPGTLRAARSLDLEGLRPLLEQSGAHFVALEYLDCSAEVEAFNGAGREHVLWWPEVRDSLEECTALVAALDLVVTVTTATAHIAGALGRPVWVLVPSVPSWRYLWQGETMPWYPTMRIFRGHGSRDALLAGVRQALAAGWPAEGRA